MSIEGLLDIRDRLSRLTQEQEEPSAEGKATPFNQHQIHGATDAERIAKEIASVILSLDLLIAEAKREKVMSDSLEAELFRTTMQPIKPPATGGPHEIKWGF
jgi:hypothetical protein